MIEIVEIIGLWLFFIRFLERKSFKFMVMVHFLWWVVEPMLLSIKLVVSPIKKSS